MLKQEKLKIEDTNLALFGSPLEREVKKHAAEGEPAWKALDKTCVGLQIWRVEQFKIVAWPKDKYGKFHTGDSYIVLRTYKKDDKILYDIHFWLGLETSQDEAGTAAYKTVELDTYLDDLPVQYREVQGSESDKFISLFNEKYEVLPGGVASGFKKVEKEKFETRLLHIKGKVGKTVARPVYISADSLNMGDVFILDDGEKIITFQPPQAGVGEKTAAAQIVASIKGTRTGVCKDSTFGWNDDDDHSKYFWNKVNGGKKPEKIKSAAEGGDDANVAQKVTKKLYKVSDASGSLKVEEVTYAFKSLHTDDVFIVDSVDTIFVWIGKGATLQEKRSGVQIAQSFLNDQPSRNKKTPIVRLHETSASSNDDFLAQFKN